MGPGGPRSVLAPHIATRSLCSGHCGGGGQEEEEEEKEEKEIRPDEREDEEEEAAKMCEHNCEAISCFKPASLACIPFHCHLSMLSTSADSKWQTYPIVYAKLYSVPLRRRIFDRGWKLELDRQQRVMRRMLAFVLDSVTYTILSYLDAGRESDRCFWVCRRKMGPDISRCAASMLDLRRHVRWDVGVLLRQQFWHVHLDKPRDRCGHERSWKMALVEIQDFLWFHSRSQRRQRVRDELRFMFKDILCDQNTCNLWM